MLPMKDVSLKTISANGVLALSLMASAACGKKDTARTAFDTGVARPDTYPVMLNKDMPFRYPPALYAEKVQGNVTLRLYVDTAGAVVNDSTKVVESSKSTMLDSAAIIGTRELRFVPAKLHGTPMPVSILFPVYFRHPEAPALAGDTILKKVPVSAADSAAAHASKDTSKSNKSNSSGPLKSSSGRRRNR